MFDNSPQVHLHHDLMQMDVVVVSLADTYWGPGITSWRHVLRKANLDADCYFYFFFVTRRLPTNSTLFWFHSHLYTTLYTLQNSLSTVVYELDTDDNEFEYYLTVDV